MKKRTIAVITGSRADYWHLYWLMRAIGEDSRLNLQVMVTGSHLSSKFGMTGNRIAKDGFNVTAKIPVLSDNSTAGVAVSVGKGCMGFANAFKKHKPNMIVVLGDRFELLAASIAAYIAKIPIAHLHGGETTRGLIDEGIRHSITKMASFHCTATKTYRNRVIQMGENPKSVFLTGAPGLDQVYRLKLLTKAQLEQQLNIDLSKPVLLVTYHPVTLDQASPEAQVKELLAAIKASGYAAIFTKANSDPCGVIINQAIESFCRQNPSLYQLRDSLGQPLFYSCLKHCAVMVGNSSSGLIETPSFAMPTINIGDRQQDRIRGTNVLDVNCKRAEILKALQKAISPKFRLNISKDKNPYDPYGDGKNSWRIKEILVKANLNEDTVKKEFYNLKISK